MRDVIAKAAASSADAARGMRDENNVVQQSRAAVLQRVAEQSERRALSELHTAYRFTGKTVVQLKDHHGIAIRFDTSFDSAFRFVTVTRSPVDGFRF